MSLRRPAVAGQFYPAPPGRLRQTIESLLSEVDVDPAPDRVCALLVPHAGYPYSGPTAAHAFARVRGKQPARVVLLGRSHHFQFEGISVYTRGAFETPLGTLPIDEEFATEVAEHLGNVGMRPHVPEHGLEVELPFLQVTLGTPRIVPILFGADSCPWHVEAGRTLGSLMAPTDLLIISTDLSHFLNESTANALDQDTLNTILSQDCAAVAAGERTGTCSMCGTPAVVAGMACALTRGARDWRLLDYRTSAQASGDTERVVGYGAISMERSERGEPGNAVAPLS